MCLPPIAKGQVSNPQGRLIEGKEQYIGRSEYRVLKKENAGATRDDYPERRFRVQEIAGKTVGNNQDDEGGQPSNNEAGLKPATGDGLDYGQECGIEGKMKIDEERLTALQPFRFEPESCEEIGFYSEGRILAGEY